MTETLRDAQKPRIAADHLRLTPQRFIGSLPLSLALDIRLWPHLNGFSFAANNTCWSIKGTAVFGLLKVLCLRNYPTGCLRYDTPDTMHFMSEQRMPMLQNTGTTQLSTFLRVSPLQSALLFLVVLGGCKNR